MGTISRTTVLFLELLAGSPVAAQVTRCVSVDGSGIPTSGFSPSISANGRYVAFESDSPNLVPGDSFFSHDIFVRDLVSGTTEIVSVDPSGSSVFLGTSNRASISADGGYVAFESNANSLVPGDSYVGSDVFVRDRVAGITDKVSVNSLEEQPVGDPSFAASISADGRYIAFHSGATNLVTGDTNLTYDVFVRDRVAGTTERVSVSTSGVQGNDWSQYARISADGRFVAFTSSASNLVASDTNGANDVFVHDRVTHTTELVSIATNGTQAIHHSEAGAISHDGRFVAFTSLASNLAGNDTNQALDAFVRDRLLGTTERVSVNTDEDQGNSSTSAFSISADGRFVALWSDSSNLVLGDNNQVVDVFVRDRLTGTTERQSLDSEGAQANRESYGPALSADGRWIAFSSRAYNLVPGDSVGGAEDVFVRDRDSPGFVIQCDPGGVLSFQCPCSNPPAGPSRGCDNSAATGGATLRASGVTRLSADSLVFTTSGQKPTALSIVLQGTTYFPSAVVYGQGYRCVGGLLKRLYAKSAIGGSITVPDFGAGDLSVSAQSASKGDVIQPGQPRWYLVYYRDTTVLGGCPATGNFNATHTGQVNWAP